MIILLDLYHEILVEGSGGGATDAAVFHDVRRSVDFSSPLSDFQLSDTGEATMLRRRWGIKEWINIRLACL